MQKFSFRASGLFAALCLCLALFALPVAKAQTPGVMGSNAMCANASGSLVLCGSNSNPISASLLGAGSSTGSDKGTVTVSVAASNSVNRASADVRCTGTNDAACINNAIANNCPNDQTGVAGCVVLLQNGVYNTEGPVIIDRDDVTLTGQNHCMWGGYNGVYPVGDAVGTGCAQLRATGQNYNLVQINHNNSSGTGSDGGRHRGILIQWLYLVGDNYTGTGVYSNAMDDNTDVIDNVIQKVSTGLNLYSDSGVIERNSIQDVSGDAVVTSGVFVRVHENLLFDDGGNCITNVSEDAVISDNILGDCSYGVYLGSNHSKVVANSFSPTAKNAVLVGAGKSGNVITGNSINWVNALYGYANKLPIPYPAIDASQGKNTSVAGNSFDNSIVQNYPAIDFGPSGTGTYEGNSFGGTWGAGNPVNASFGNKLNGEVTLSSGAKSFTFLTQSSAHPACFLTDDTSGALVYPSFAGVSGGYTVTLNGTTSDVIDYRCEDSAGTGQIQQAGTPTYPTVSNALTLAYDFDATTLTGIASGSLMSNWPTTNNANVNMTAGGTARPTYISPSPISSKPAVLFNGTQFTTASNPLGTPTLTACAVAYVSAYTANPDGAGSLFGWTSSGQFGITGYINQNTGAANLYGGSSGFAGSVVPVTTPQVLCYVLNGSSSAVVVNGVSTSGSVNAVQTTNNFAIGNAANGVEGFNGYIGRLIVYNGAASSSDIAAITATLRSEFSF